MGWRVGENAVGMRMVNWRAVGATDGQLMEYQLTLPIHVATPQHNVLRYQDVGRLFRRNCRLSCQLPMSTFLTVFLVL